MAWNMRYILRLYKNPIWLIVATLVSIGVTAHAQDSTQAKSVLIVKTSLLHPLEAQLSAA